MAINSLSLKQIILREFLLIFPFALYLSSIWSLEYFNIFIILPAGYYVITRSNLKVLDLNGFLILLYSLLYFFLNKITLSFEETGYVGLIQQNLLPFLFYIMGKYLNRNYDDPIQKSYIVVIVAFIFSINPFLSNLVSIIEFGYMSSRDVSLLVSGLVDRQLSATNMASFFLMNMSFFPFVLINTNNKNERNIKNMLIGLFVIGLIAVSNVSTRTGILISVISWLCALFFNKASSAFKILGRSFLYLLIIALFIFLSGSLEKILSTDLYSRFTEDDDNSLLNSRSNIWEEAFKIIFQTSDDNFIDKQMDIAEYAHNLWLDVALKAGNYPLIILLIITIKYLITLGKILTMKLYTPFFRILMVCITVAFYSTFMVEPIMDGYFTLFCLYCFFFGFIDINYTIDNSKIPTTKLS
jgi:hypothetical protein